MSKKGVLVNRHSYGRQSCYAHHLKKDGKRVYHRLERRAARIKRMNNDL